MRSGIAVVAVLLHETFPLKICGSVGVSSVVNMLSKAIASMGVAASCFCAPPPQSCLASEIVPPPSSQLHSFEKRLAKQQYVDLAKSGDRAKLADLNRYVVDYTFGTITNMFFDQTGGENIVDGLAWRSKLKRIESADGGAVFSSAKETDRVIGDLIGSLGDEYSYYKSPFMEQSDEPALGAGADRVRFPYLGFELSTSSSSNQFDSLYTPVLLNTDQQFILNGEPSYLTSTSPSSSFIFATADKTSHRPLPPLEGRADKLNSHMVVMDDVSKWGAVVTKIYPQSPAERSGLRIGDILLECNGVDLSSSSSSAAAADGGADMADEETRKASIRAASFSDDFDSFFNDRENSPGDISPLTARRHKIKEILTGGQDFGVPVRLSVLRPPPHIVPSGSSIDDGDNDDRTAAAIAPPPPLSRLLYHLSLTPETKLQYTTSSGQTGPSRTLSNRPTLRAQRHSSSSFRAPFGLPSFQSPPGHNPQSSSSSAAAAVSLQELRGGFWASSKLCDTADMRSSASCNNLISYIRLTAFTRPATNDFARVLKQQVDKDTSLIVIDLRNNYGGIIQDAMVDASLFLADDPDTVLCYTVGPRGFAVHDVSEWLWSGSLLDQVQRQAGWVPHNNLTPSPDDQVQRQAGWVPQPNLTPTPDDRPSSAVDTALSSISNVPAASSISIVPASIPVAILVNEGTASAAEMFAAALQENNRATVIGSRTYGKSAIQHDFLLPNGGHMHLTVAEYLTPKRNHFTRTTATATATATSTAATTATAAGATLPPLSPSLMINPPSQRGAAVGSGHKKFIDLQRNVAYTARTGDIANSVLFSEVAAAAINAAASGVGVGASVGTADINNGLVPDVMCSDAPVPDASKDFCTIEAISIML